MSKPEELSPTFKKLFGIKSTQTKVLKPTEALSKAIALAAKVFESKTDKGGQPYMLHCLRVMGGVDQNDHELMAIAALHDVVEDSTISLDDLTAMGFNSRIVTAVMMLTHSKEVPYDEYIAAISTNKDARAVKLSDLKDNTDITRLKGLREKDFARMKKYHTAYTYLKN